MKLGEYFLILGLCFGSPGCSFLVQAARNAVNEPRQLAANLALLERNHHLACQAWTDLVEADANQEYSHAYEQGFKAGYEDYLEWGGDGEPPPVPPACYRGFLAKNPEGHDAAQDWFAGFRRGARAAQESGYRQWNLVPSSSTLEAVAPSSYSPEAGQGGSENFGGPGVPPPPPQVPAVEELPLPEKIPAGGEMPPLPEWPNPEGQGKALERGTPLFNRSLGAGAGQNSLPPVSTSARGPLPPSWSYSRN